MCGIAGIIRWSGREDDSKLLGRMTDVMSHRGPDDSGHLIVGPRKEGNEEWFHVDSTAKVLLGHRRLSILDLTRDGRQPMARGGGKRWIIHNGEVYNYLELRGLLEREGHIFLTRTDTEVLLTAYEEWGESFITRCNGMFATAILDLEVGRLFIYRDRMGIKPLYFTYNRSRFLFSSEIKALLECPQVPREVDSSAVYAYFSRQIVDHREETFFSGIRSLRPGHILEIDIHSPHVNPRPYYELKDAVAAVQEQSDPVNALRDVLRRSMQYRLRSDVRVGACLSGGLDSSSIVCMVDSIVRQSEAGRRSVGQELNTFSSCHEDSRYDERPYIREVVNRCRIRPFFIFSKPEDLNEELDRLVWHQDEPFTSPSIFGQYCLMRKAKEEGVAVLLDGQGGDELFLGYRKFYFFYLRQLLIQKQFHSVVTELAGGIWRGDGDLFNLRAATRYLPGFAGRGGQGIRGAFNKGFRENEEASAPNIGGGASLLDRQIADIAKFSLPALLRYEDRNSMAFSIEARVPFLDHEVVELALSLPEYLKIKGGVSKFVLREAMRATVPPMIIDRRTKMGFVMPEEAWVRGPLSLIIEDALGRRDGVLARFFERDIALKAFHRFRDKKPTTIGPRDFFRMACLDIWARAFSVSA